MLKQIEKIFSVAMLFYMTGAVLPFVFGIHDRAVRVEGNVTELALQAALHAIAFGFIAIHWRTVLRATWDAKWILALVAVAIASSAWSEDPLFTLRRSIVLLASTMYAIYFGGRFTLAEQLRLLSWTFALVVCTSLFIVIFLPQYGVGHDVFLGAWLGAFPQRNLTARAMVLAALVFYFVRPSAVRWIRWVGVAASLCLIAESRSATGSIMIIVMIAILLSFRMAKLNLTALVPVLIGIGTSVIALAFLIWTNQSQLFALVGRDSTLSGRTDLWSAALISISRHPWLGYGFNAFWAGMQGKSYSVQLSVGSYMGHSHCGFLDLTLDLGLLGLATFFAGYLVLSGRALQLVRRVPGPASYWLCAFLCLRVFYNLDDAALLRQDDIFWVLYASTAVNISTFMRERFLSNVPVLRHRL
ncbi:MAG: O-antigen ligase family protein [Terriglobia bacterium]|jgi:O-antigen ligase